jgi:ribosomal protein S18 acetylase RimI-like enzyme
VLALAVEDAWQHRGIGTKLARRLTDLALARGFDTFVATIMPENRPALGLLCKLAPQASVRSSLGEYEASIPLTPR